MINDYLRGALAAQRLDALLAEAEAAHRAKQARLRRRQARPSRADKTRFPWLSRWLRWGETRPRAQGPAQASLAGADPGAKRHKRIVLRDGSRVLIRQVQSADAPLLAEGFDQLSAESRRARFLTPKKGLSPAELRYFTEVDHHDHEALGAVLHADGRGVGIARYVRHEDDPQAAEIAVTIVDDWQGRGLGTELLTQLAGRASQEGIRRFTAQVAADNLAMIGLLHNMTDIACVRREYDIWEYEIRLAPEASAA
jgi:RimJ/RimL family protein N-acetyltransferase